MLDLSLVDATAALVQVCDEELEELDAIHLAALKRLRPDENVGPVDLGSLPEHPSEGYEALVEFLGAVGDAQISLKEYIEASSWNPYRNTLIRGFGTGLLDGFIGTITGASKAPAPKWSDVAADSGEFVSRQFGVFREDLDRAKAEALTEVSKKGVGLLDGVIRKVTSLVKEKVRTVADAVMGNES